MPADSMDLFSTNDPDLRAQIDAARGLAFQEGSLSLKTQILIALAIDATKQAEGGVRSLALQALEAGATKQEIMETLRIVNYICGVGSMYTAASALTGVL